MAKRPVCTHCELPQSVCICDLIAPLTHHTRLIVLQHPQEAKHAKNSVRLLKHISRNIEVIVGETAADFSEIRKKLGEGTDKTVLLFPGETSQPLEEKCNQARPDPVFDSLLLIDATWRKALKIFLLNPWLQALPQFHFASAPDKRYAVRKSSQPNQLSTLEAAAYALQVVEGWDPEPLLAQFDAYQARLFARHPHAPG